MANSEDILRSILDQKPNDTKTAFDAVMKDKLETDVEAYKAQIASQMLGEPETEEDDFPIDLDNLSDEDLEAISNMSDEELEAVLQDALNDEDKEQEVEPEEPASDEETA